MPQRSPSMSSRSMALARIAGGRSRRARASTSRSTQPSAALVRHRATSTPTRATRRSRTRFARWHWSRASHARRHRDAVRRASAGTGRARRSRVHFDRAGKVDEYRAAAARSALPPTRWRIDARDALRRRASRRPSLRTLEDAPFYARSLVGSHLARASRRSPMHESLSLDRFRARLGADAAAVPDAARGLGRSLARRARLHFGLAVAALRTAQRNQFGDREPQHQHFDQQPLPLERGS